MAMPYGSSGCCSGAPDYSDEDIKKCLVILTDGVQTEKAWGETKSHSVPNGEANLETMCTNIKAQGSHVITIVFDLNDGWTEARLKNCASTPDDFHNAENNAGLADVFEEIAGKQVQQVRISK